MPYLIIVKQKSSIQQLGPVPTANVWAQVAALRDSGFGEVSVVEMATGAEVDIEQFAPNPLA
jgi:hypothetical protein